MLITSGQLNKEVPASLNDSVSSYESIINDLTPEESKFYSAFIENWQLFQAHVSSHDVIHTHHLFGSKFVVPVSLIRRTTASKSSLTMPATASKNATGTSKNYFASSPSTTTPARSSPKKHISDPKFVPS